MGDKRKFRIGQPVLVNLNDQVVAKYDRGEYRRVARVKHWHGHNLHTNDPVLAIVTGVKEFREGKYHAGSTSGHGFLQNYDDYEPAYTTTDNVVFAWAVRLGYKNKEIYFFEEDLKPYGNTHKIFDQYICFDLDNIPFLYTGWSDYYRKQMSRESKDWPRDEKGRWSK